VEPHVETKRTETPLHEALALWVVGALFLVAMLIVAYIGLNLGTPPVA
jgi:type VI protein secretion system component VasF